jgi:hypothetical protein
MQSCKYLRVIAARDKMHRKWDDILSSSPCLSRPPGRPTTSDIPPRAAMRRAAPHIAGLAAILQRGMLMALLTERAGQDDPLIAAEMNGGENAFRLHASPWPAPASFKTHVSSLMSLPICAICSA